MGIGSSIITLLVPLYLVLCSFFSIVIFSRSYTGPENMKKYIHVLFAASVIFMNAVGFMMTLQGKVIASFIMTGVLIFQLLSTKMGLASYD